jgi:hypothetical protein
MKNQIERWPTELRIVGEPTRTDIVVAFLVNRWPLLGAKMAPSKARVAISCG